MSGKSRLRIAFDIGGVLSRYPDFFRRLVRKLIDNDGFGEPVVDVYILTDMHPKEMVIETLRLNKFLPEAENSLWWWNIPENRILVADYKKYGEGCKAELLREHEIDLCFDDHLGYLMLGDTIRFLLVPNAAHAYYHPSWKSVPSMNHDETAVKAAMERVRAVVSDETRFPMSRRNLADDMLRAIVEATLTQGDPDFGRRVYVPSVRRTPLDDMMDELAKHPTPVAPTVEFSKEFVAALLTNEAERPPPVLRGNAAHMRQVVERLDNQIDNIALTDRLRQDIGEILADYSRLQGDE